MIILSYCADVAKFLKGVSTTFNSEIRSCFSEVLLTRGHHLSEVDRDVSRMATLMERICPSTEEYESMRARGNNYDYKCFGYSLLLDSPSMHEAFMADLLALVLYYLKPLFISLYISIVQYGLS